MRSKVFLAVALAASLPVGVPAQVAGEGATDIVRYYGRRASLIQLVGVRANHKVEVASQGSGLLLDDRHVLTNNHVVPDVADRYLSMTTNVHRRNLRTVFVADPPTTGGADGFVEP